MLEYLSQLEESQLWLRSRFCLLVVTFEGDGLRLNPGDYGLSTRTVSPGFGASC